MPPRRKTATVPVEMEAADGPANPFAGDQPPMIARDQPLDTGERLMSLDVIHATAGDWTERPESADPLWVPLRFGRFVVAFRCR